MSSKSIQHIKYGAFIHEFNNILNLEPLEYQDTEYLAVRKYFQERIEDIKKELSENE